jgi:hypothetical protein
MTSARPQLSLFGETASTSGDEPFHEGHEVVNASLGKAVDDEAIELAFELGGCKGNPNEQRDTLRCFLRNTTLPKDARFLVVRMALDRSGYGEAEGRAVMTDAGALTEGQIATFDADSGETEDDRALRAQTVSEFASAKGNPEEERTALSRFLARASALGYAASSATDDLVEHLETAGYRDEEVDRVIAALTAPE